MPKYTKKEFADLCKQQTKYLSVQISRGKVIVDPEGNINTSNAINASYVEKIYGRMDIATGKLPPATTKSRKPDKLPLEFDLDDESGEGGLTLAQMLESKDIKNLTYPELEKIYKYRQGENLKRTTEKIDIEIAKKKGEVIPSDLLPPVIVQHNQAFITSFRNVVDQILTDYTQIKDFSPDEIAEMRARLLEVINKGANDALTMSLKSIENIVKDYTEKRGVGQKT